MNYPSINRLVDLQQLIVDFAKIERIPQFADIPRKETDVDHSFGLALTCWYLQPKIAPHLDIGKILQYALAHDIVEVHAGDTYSFDEEALKTKDSREQAALERLQHDWPDFSELTDSTKDYMEKTNEEAKFVKAVDKMLPVFMFELTPNPQKAWRERGIGLDMERTNKVSMHVSDIISPYYEQLINWLDERDNIPKH